MKPRSSPTPVSAGRPARRRRGPLPFVLINMAMTADGKIATANRRVSSFGSARDREHLYELRATADAVMAGARTLDLNEVHLGSGGVRFERERLRHGLQKHNLRIVVSGSGTIRPGSAIFRHRFAPILVLTTARVRPARLRLLQALADEVLVCGEEELDLATAFAELRRKWKVKRLLCEGGGEMNAALFRARLVDEVHLTICAKVFGGSLAPTIAEGVGVRRLADAVTMRLVSARQIGPELFARFKVQSK
jgi:2,5-diamino-6-(ribosylamino)-4(3H)-pyrimidinone 5'-phosphate reductase